MPVEALPPRTDRQARAIELTDAATKLAALVALSVPDEVFALWLAPLRMVDAQTGRVFLAAPPDLARWVQGRFAGLLSACASELADKPVEAVVVVADTLPSVLTFGELLNQRGAA